MHRFQDSRLSWRALALVTVAAALFVASAVLWLQHPTDEVARFAVVPTALVLAVGTISYALFSGTLTPGPLPKRARRR